MLLREQHPQPTITCVEMVDEGTQTEEAVVTKSEQESRPFEVTVGLPTLSPLAASSPRHARTATESLQPAQSAAREIHFSAVAKDGFVSYIFSFAPTSTDFCLDLSI